MVEPVNLNNLREMIGGDPEIEQELFSVFIDSSKDCIENLRNNLDDTCDKIWRQHAHAWKGMSLNLGAEPLSELCEIAQIKEDLTRKDKEDLLKKMEEEYRKVKSYLIKL